MAHSRGGIASSRHHIDLDMAEINTHKTCYLQAGASYCIHPAVIAALASRETRSGKLLYNTHGLGDNHNAYGIMQCDINADPLHSINKTCTSYPWNSCDHINAMTKYVLVRNIKDVLHKHPTWSSEKTLQVAAYNFGLGNVQTWTSLDVGTTHNDYSNEVIARAQWLISHHQW